MSDLNKCVHLHTWPVYTSWFRPHKEPLCHGDFHNTDRQQMVSCQIHGLFYTPAPVPCKSVCACITTHCPALGRWWEVVFFCLKALLRWGECYQSLRTPAATLSPSLCPLPGVWDMATCTCMNTYTHIWLCSHRCICLFRHTAQLGSRGDEDKVLQGLTKILSVLFIKSATQNGHEFMSSVAGAGARDPGLFLNDHVQRSQHPLNHPKEPIGKELKCKVLFYTRKALVECIHTAAIHET